MRTPIRRRAGALLVLVPFVCISLATAVPAAADELGDKKAEAARIARQLEQQGRQVSVLAEDYDEAQVKIAEVEVELTAAGAKVARTDEQASTIRARLKEQAVASYVRGGTAQALALLVDTQRSEDLAVRSQYVRTLTSGATDVLDELRAVRLQLDEQRDRLDRAREDARAAAAVAEQKREEATRAAAAQERTLQQVQGELAVLVEAESQRRAAEQAERAKAELAARQARIEADARDAAAKEAAARQVAADQAARRAASVTSTTTATAKPAATPSGSAPVTARPTTTRPTTTRPPATTTPERSPATSPDAASNPGPPAAGADAAIAEARRQLGKPYEWGGSGPDSFDCSGLTSWAWRAGGKRLSHSSRAQWSETSRVGVDDLQPGDLLFYGNPIHHVGLYIGDGQMIEAPETGKNVRIASIYRSGYTGAGRVN